MKYIYAAGSGLSYFLIQKENFLQNSFVLNVQLGKAKLDFETSPSKVAQNPLN